MHFPSQYIADQLESVEVTFVTTNGKKVTAKVDPKKFIKSPHKSIGSFDTFMQHEYYDVLDKAIRQNLKMTPFIQDIVDKKITSKDLEWKNIQQDGTKHYFSLYLKDGSKKYEYDSYQDAYFDIDLGKDLLNKQ